MLEKEDYQNLCDIVKGYTGMEKYELNEKQRSDETASLRDMASRVFAIQPEDLQEEAIETVDKYLELRGKGTGYFSLIFRNFVREVDELAESLKK